jgi:hypothetical protein
MWREIAKRAITGPRNLDKSTLLNQMKGIPVVLALDRRLVFASNNYRRNKRPLR